MTVASTPRPWFLISYLTKNFTMFKKIRKTLLAAVCLLAVACQCVAADKADTLRVLWIGNSYTFFNDLPTTVREIAESKGMHLNITSIVKGGEHLKGHLKNPRLTEALKRGHWDYVIIQEFSSAPAADTRTVARDVYPYARTIDSLALKHSPQAKVIFYMTWGHKYGNVYDSAYKLDDDYESMQERLKTSYLEMTYDNNAWCAPVGMAWREIRHTHPEYILYNADCFHPSPLGSYLAANVIFATIWQRPYQTSVTKDLPADQAEVIQQTAQRTVLDNLRLLNIAR